MIYTIENCTIARFSQILKNDKFISKYRLPKRIRLKAKNRLILEFNKIIKGTDDERERLKKYHLITIYCKMQQYENLHQSLNLAVTEENKAYYKKLFHREYKHSELKNLRRMTDRVIMQYETELEDNNTDEDFDFDKYVMHIESALSVEIQDKMLYQIKIYHDKAFEKINEREDA